MNARDEAELLQSLVSRRDVLAAFRRAETSHPKDLESELGMSRSTVHRVLSTLVERDVLEKIGQRYRLTAYGIALVEEGDRFADRVRITNTLRPLVADLRALPEPFDPDDFAHATTSRSTPEDPYRPVTRYLELFEETSSVRSIQTTARSPPEVMARYVERLDEGLQATVLWTEAVLDHWLETQPDFMTAAVEHENLTMFVVEDAPVHLILHDDRVFLPWYDPTTGTPTLLVDADDPDAVAWGETVFESYRNIARPFAEEAVR